MGKVYRSADRRLPSDIRRKFGEYLGHEIIRPFAFQQQPLAKAYSVDEAMDVEGIANFAEGDRWGEVIDPAAWPKRLGNYRRNPIILREHRRELAVGICTDISVKGDGLYYRATVGDPKLAPLTECQLETRSLLAQTILRSNSVGFKPFEIEWDEENDLLRYTDVELLEISIVAIPMQQDSLITSVKDAGGIVNVLSWRSLMAKGNAGAAAADGADDALEAIAAVKAQVTATHELVAKLAAGGDARAKALETELADAKSKLETATKALATRETQLKSLVESMQKRGLIGKPQAA